MKKILTLAAMFGLLCAGLLTGCQKQEETSTMTPDTNAPAMPSTNMPATNAP